MRILQIAHAFPPYNNAGAENYTYSLCKQLASRHQVYIFHRISDLNQKEYEIRFKQEKNLFIYSINNTFRHCYSFKDLYLNDAITDKFEKILDEIKPDITHIQHLIFLSSGLIERIKERKIPVIFTLHDYWLICPQWHFLKKDLTPCNGKDISQCINCLEYQINIKEIPKRIYCSIRRIMPNRLLNLFKKIYLGRMKANTNSPLAIKRIEARIEYIKKICEMTDLFIAPSQFLRRRFIEFGIPEDKIKFIPNGIDTEFLKCFKKKESDRIRFGFIGTILPAKGLDILISAFSRINKDIPVELKIYGRLFPYNGFEYYPGYIKRLAKNRNIRFMGGFDHKDISSVLSEIDILVLPSIWNENCPLTILEAFSTKTPVIASRIGGIPELVKDKENGLLFEPGNPSDLYDKMSILIDNSNLINELRANLVSPKSMKENSEEIEETYKFLS